MGAAVRARIDDVQRLPGPTAWAWLLGWWISVFLFFALILLMVLLAPAFHPNLSIPGFAPAWVSLFTANILFSFFSFSRLLKKGQLEMFAGYTTLPYGSSQVELRDHMTWEVLRPAGVERLSRRVWPSLNRERARARANRNNEGS